MDRGGGAHLHRHRVSPRALLRGLLLAAVLTGIFGMHVLTADDDGNGHGSLPMISTAGMTRGPEMATTHEPRMVTAAEVVEVAAATVSGADAGSGMTHGAMAACILFLAAAAGLILGLLGYRRLARATGPGGAACSALTGIRRRGPPGRYRPRVALCVIRT